MHHITRRHVMGGMLVVAALPRIAFARPQTKWVTSWAASSQGPYPSGAMAAMPDQGFVFPEPASAANDQSFRMIVRPSVWAEQTRLRFSNAFGTQPVTLDDVFVGLQLASAALVPNTNTPVLFAGRRTVTLAPGMDVWSDPVALPFAAPKNATMLAGRKLAVSFHVAGSSGPMTWHAKGMQTSYVSLPHAGSHGHEDAEHAFPMSSTAWFFLNAVDMRMPGDTPLVVCLGDSITDGSNSTLNGDDRWPDVLQRRFAAHHPNSVAVVDAGIGSNQIMGPETYDVHMPYGGGPSALQRMDRDVAALSGVTTVIWFEGINDLSWKENPATAEAVIGGLRSGVAKLRKIVPGVRIVGATITPALGARGNAGTEETDAKRKVINAAIRSGDMFDAYIDFAQAVQDPQSGALKPEFVPNTTIGGPGDQLHPNRVGYQAMGGVIDLEMVLPGFGARR